jgi:UDP-4-amino-4,6-dideoxy-N-acetyl-beta-L-altrosamine N-acetyltransferase
MTEYASIKVRKMRENDLEYVLTWRNHPDVRQFMLTQHEITAIEHRAWFNSASNDETRALLVLEEDDQPVGCVAFSGIQPYSTSDWSFYSCPLRPSGTGTRICSAALDFAFNTLGVHKVEGQVLHFNSASIRIHQRLGFTQEGTLRENILINGTHHDLLCFGILSREWFVRKNIY